MTRIPEHAGERRVIMAVQGCRGLVQSTRMQARCTTRDEVLWIDLADAQVGAEGGRQPCANARSRSTVRWMLLGTAGDCWGRVGELARLLAVAVGRCGGRLARVTADDRPCKLDVDQAAVEAESQRKWDAKQQVP
jgi:hypothetical protein